MTIVRAIGWVLLFPAVLIVSYGLVAGLEGVAVFEVSAACTKSGPAGPPPAR